MPAKAGDSPGNIDLTATSSGQTIRFAGTFVGEVTLPVQNINKGATPVQAMNAFLAQYAFCLFTNDALEEGNVLNLMTDKARVRAQIAAAKTAFRKQVGEQSLKMPIFWDTHQAPARFTATHTAAGVQVTLAGGTLYYSIYNPAKNGQWQDPRGRDASHRTIITKLIATFGPSTDSDGYSVSYVRSFSLH